MNASPWIHACPSNRPACFATVRDRIGDVLDEPRARRPAPPQGPAAPAAHRRHGPVGHRHDERGGAARWRSAASPRSCASAAPTCSTCSERERLVNEVLDETFGLGPLEPLMRDPTITDILINGPKTVYVERNGRLEQADVVVPRRPAPAADHPADRRPGRPARRRDEPDGRRPPARRQPRQRHHPAAGPGRRPGVDPPLRRQAAPGRRTWSPSKSITPEMVEFLAACVQGAAQHAHLRRHRQRQDDAAQRPVGVHSRRRARRHHRGRRRAAAAAAARRPAGDPAGQHRRASAR